MAIYARWSFMGVDTQLGTAGGTRAQAMLALARAVRLGAIGLALPDGTAAEQASEPTSSAAAALDAGRRHTCALLTDGNGALLGIRQEGQLGYANTDVIGDDETPAAAGPVDLGRGRTAVAISAGDYHTCALLDDRTVRCWGFGGNGGSATRGPVTHWRRRDAGVGRPGGPR